MTGTDNSEAMLASARKRLPQARFELSDIGRWQPATPPDLIYANAALQWVPDHEALIPRLFAALAPGGVLAVQMPDNRMEPSHTSMVEAAAEMPFADKIRNAGRGTLPPVSFYYDLLTPLSARVDIWHTIYNHPMTGPNAIVEWVKATGLKPFLDPLDEPERAQFVERYRDKIALAYPPLADGKSLLRFPRLFIVAVKG